LYFIHEQSKIWSGNNFFQDRDLKQYMDDCGNIMSMNNVKVRDTRYIGESP